MAASTWRFIPAPAGNTQVIRYVNTQKTVHPRACGEHCKHETDNNAKCGSSPRLRGTLLVPSAWLVWLRFIPAPAGNTQGDRTADGHDTVHPRACGEHWLAMIFSTMFVGSSPRLRGTRACAYPQAPGARFIPAPAGNTAHTSSDMLLKGGSSPRLRGTLEVQRSSG